MIPTPDLVREKNVEVISTVSPASNVNDLHKQLDTFSVQIIFPTNMEKNVNAITCRNMLLNLLPRFLKTVAYDGPVVGEKTFPPSHFMKIKNGQISDPSITIIFGNVEHDSIKNVLYVGSVGWSIYVSNKKACEWKPFPINGLSALYAAGIIAGEIFKYMLPDEFTDKITHFEYDLVTHGNASQPVCEPSIPDVINFDNVAILGCGAIGQAFCAAVRMTSKLTGSLMLIDNDVIDESNEQRYVFSFMENRNMPKVQHLASILSISNPTLVINGSIARYEDVMSQSHIKFNEIITLVDNIKTRINAQAALPKILWNAWTDTSKSILRYGAGRHMLAGPYQCVACSYYSNDSISNQIELDSLMTGFTNEEIKVKTSGNYLTTKNDIDHINNHNKIIRQELYQHVGKPFSSLLHGLCGVYSRSMGESHATTPAPHTSLLAGIFLASQFVLRQLPLSDSSKLMDSVADFNALGIPNSACITKSQRRKSCFCNDVIYQQVYNKIWRNHI